MLPTFFPINTRARRGFSLIDTVVAVGLLALLSAVITSVILAESRSWTRARAERNAVDAGETILSRLTQEIRLAQSVNTVQSTLGSHPGQLVLNTFASPTSSDAAVLDVVLSGTDLTLSRGGAPATISGAARVTNLIFYRLASSTAEAVRVELTVEAGTGEFLTVRRFTTAAVLRGGY